jgi:hypothetical protein
MIGPEMGSGAEEMLAGGPLATGSGAAGTTGLSLPTLEAIRQGLKDAALGGTIGSTGKQLLFPQQQGRLRPSPMATPPRATPYRGPTSEPLAQLLARKMAERRMPALRF